MNLNVIFLSYKKIKLNLISSKGFNRALINFLSNIRYTHSYE